MGKLRVAIIGVGNCASSFVQGLHYYRNAKETDRIPGLMHVNLGGYHVRDVEISAAIDIDRNKVGKEGDTSEAIGEWPNNTLVFAKVRAGSASRCNAARRDGTRRKTVADHPQAPGSTVIVKLLKDTKTDVVVNACRSDPRKPRSGTSSRCSAGCAFVNCIRVPSPARSTGSSASRKKSGPAR
jgi:myo-inositol-1-phosphate synthase